jgi:hypothetical protein
MAACEIGRKAAPLRATVIFDIGAMASGRLESVGPKFRETSAGPLQALADGLLEHGLVADAGLFGDPPGLFEIGDWDAN